MKRGKGIGVCDLKVDSLKQGSFPAICVKSMPASSEFEYHKLFTLKCCRKWRCRIVRNSNPFLLRKLGCEREVFLTVLKTGRHLSIPFFHSTQMHICDTLSLRFMSFISA